MRILCLYGGPVQYLGNFIESLSQYAEVDGTNIFTDIDPDLPYSIDTPQFNKISNKTHIREQDYDFVLGLDNGTIPVVNQIQSLTSIKGGVLLLDYPKHAFKTNKDYVPSVVARWHEWKPMLRNLDFIIHCRQNVQLDLKDVLADKPNMFHILPCKPINFVPEQYERKDYIMYSGAINPSKGVHYIINALSILERKPEFVVVGQGKDLTDYANFLKVPYRQLNNISEVEKFKMYHECRFVVYGHDTGVIPGLCVIEAMSIGRYAICFDFPEHKVMYQHGAAYCQPNHVSLANSIKHFYDLGIEATDKCASLSPKFVQENASFDSWAKKTIEFLEKL